MTIQELRERQSWNLDQKIDHSLGVIDQFISILNGQVYVGFSGGKDSTVLLDLCRIIKPDIKAVFCNTGNEYPDIVRFVRELKNTEGYNIEIIYPMLKPREVFEKYGFPLISKDISETLFSVKNSPESVKAMRGLGVLNQYKYHGEVPKKWIWIRDEKFNINNKCCSKLKKEPFHKYEKEYNLYPILGVMACESIMRQTAYIKQGSCNVFNKNGGGRFKSLPLSIWLEDDIWKYIERRNLKIADIYHKGAKRTGCMFCGYGIHFKDDNRLKMCYDMYPKMYQTFMNYTNNGVTYREAARKVLAVNGLMLPDENRQLELFE